MAPTSTDTKDSFRANAPGRTRELDRGRHATCVWWRCCACRRGPVGRQEPLLPQAEWRSVPLRASQVPDGDLVNLALM